MKYFLLLGLVLTFWCSFAQETAKTAAELKKEIGKIMHDTDWTNQKDADSANVKIAELSKQMMMIGARQQAPQNVGSGEQYEEKIKEDVEYKMQLWNQMWKISKQGEGAKIDLADPLMNEIVEEYKEDDNPTIKNPDWQESMPELTINMSMPYVQVVIDQMPVFKGIIRLVITCEEAGTPVNLEEILMNAKDYPLNELYILNFGSSVSSLPLRVGDFKEITILNLFNNNLDQLPASVSGLTLLKTLYVDLNPLHEILTVVSPLKKLGKLGVAKTGISQSEIEQIQQLLPECNILVQ
ncbi:MAG: leucine-rich repeat domain-containing protein [Bacteroidales bacterium]|nr:leucine-rich repeat domain-containing protein [Bacteroidales bacterium]